MNMNKRTFLKACSAVLTSRVLSPLLTWSSNQKLTNWAGNFEYGTEKIYSAKSVKEVQDFVRNRNKFKVLGTRHCFNKIADTKAEFLSLKALDQVVKLDANAKTATIEAGLSYGQLCPYLDREGWALHNLASLPHISVAGACSTATHGSGEKNGNLATEVSALEMVIANGDLVTIFHAPGLEVSSVDQRFRHTPFYWSFDTSLEGLRRSEPGFDTPNLVGRYDIEPRVSMPVFYKGWTFRPEVALRNTFYTEQLVPNSSVGLAVQEVVNRRAVETSVELRPPTLGKIFERTIKGRKVKHTIEPRLVYRYTNGVGNFPSIIRFDFRDILSDTNEVEYGLTQRLFLKRANQDCDTETKAGSGTQAQPQASPPSGNCPPAGANEFISWELKQKYFFQPDFGGAVVNGRRNVLTTTEDFTGIAFLTDPRRFAPIVSRLRVRTSSSSDMQWELDYDTKKGSINASTFFTTFHLGDFFIGGSHAYLQAPGELFVTSPIPGPRQFNQFRGIFGYGSPTKRGLSAAANIGFDSTFSFLQYSAGQASYNWDCCGISLEYRRFALGAVRNENSFRFAFTLANIGTFGNLRRQERLF